MENTDIVKNFLFGFVCCFIIDLIGDIIVTITKGFYHWLITRKKEVIIAVENFSGEYSYYEEKNKKVD